MTVGASHEEGGANTFPEQYTKRGSFRNGASRLYRAAGVNRQGILMCLLRLYL